MLGVLFVGFGGLVWCGLGFGWGLVLVVGYVCCCVCCVVGG